MNYGATPEEWMHFDLVEGLTEDLLPVVCRPGQKIYEHSNLKAYGKVPSRYTVTKEVVGFTNWTSHTATSADIDRWCAEPDFGICLQTRRVRALDFDITDRLYAQYLRDSLDLVGYAFPYRSRVDSSKFLTLFYLEGDYGKQTLTTEHGIIEFLATGQQCVVAGTHPSGARYQWDWRHPIPTLGPDEFGHLLGFLVEITRPVAHHGAHAWSEPARSRVVDRNTVADGRDVEDPVSDYLRVRGLVLRTAPDGRAFLRCPWIDRHTSSSDITETCWFPAGTNGFEQGHFRCLHAHCQDRTDDEFLRAIGYDHDGFEVIGPPVERAAMGTLYAEQRDGETVREGLWDIGSTTDERRVGRDGREIDGGPLAMRHGDSTDQPQGVLRSESHGHDQEGWQLGLQGASTESRPDSTGWEDSRAGLPGGVRDDRASTEVLQALGADQAPKKVEAGEQHPLDLPAFERDKNGKIKPKLSNIVLALNRPDLVGAVIGRDEFKDEIAWRPWKQGLLYLPSSATFQTGNTRPFRDADYTAIQLTLTKLNFGPAEVPYDSIRRGVVYIAEQRLFDSAIHWLDTLPDWDGINRIDTFCSRYLGAEDSPYTRAVARYWWSAHAGRILVPGIQADMAVVLISEQGTGKTSSLKAIAPSPEQYVELSLTDRDEDLSRAMRGKLVGEMAELKGVKGKDVESLKAWISRQRELWVPKYLEFTRSFPRRLVLIGTTNEDEFLSDETGNRRWLPLPVGKQDVEALVRDRDQLWAEAVSLYLYEGICWSDAERLAREVHSEYMIHDDWQDTITDWLVADDGFGGGRPGDREYLFLGDILRGALHLNPNQSPVHVQKRVGAILRKMGYVKVVRRIDGESHKVWLKGCKKWQDHSM